MINFLRSKIDFKASRSLHETFHLEIVCVAVPRGFHFLDGLEDAIRFVWDGSHLLQEVQPDGRYT